MSESYPPDLPPDEEPPPASTLKGDVRNLDQAILLLIVVTVVIGAAVGILVVTLPSWRPRANMNQQAYQRPFSPNPVFADDMSERPLESGVVPRPADHSPGIPYVAVRQSGPANYPVLATSANNPLPITRQLLERGQQEFTIYCAVCHGATGRGDGMIVRRGFYPPPSYHIQRLRDLPDSHFFDVITNGYATMFSYGDRVAPDDRWAIVAYIRALELAVDESSPQLNHAMAKERG